METAHAHDHDHFEKKVCDHCKHYCHICEVEYCCQCKQVWYQKKTMTYPATTWTYSSGESVCNTNYDGVVQYHNHEKN